jgi:phospholipid transport system substrate-binding protein
MMKNVKKILQFFVGMVCLLSSYMVNAAPDPVATMQGIVNNVLAALQANRAAIDKSPEKLYSLIYQSVVPHVDFDEISKWVAGKGAWGKASDGERVEFIKQFKMIIVKTYASALKKYSDERVTFAPLRDPSKVSKRMQLSSIVFDQINNKKIKVDFRIIDAGNTWKVYDLVIEGVSLLKGFQAQFSDLIRNHGIGAAISKMRQHNASVLGEEFAKSLVTLS